jgi:hypothetical protein
MCKEHKVEVIQDGRFIYHECSICGHVTNIIYLGPKEEDGFDEDYLGI